MHGLISERAALQLVTWANACAGRFNFDAARGADPDDIREIDQVLGAQQEQLLASLRKGHEDCRSFPSRSTRSGARPQREIAKARAALAAAEKEIA